MRRRRVHISLKTKLAAALCQMLRPTADGKWERVIDHESAKKMTEDQVLSLFHFDHYPIPVHRDGPGAHWNLVPRPIPEHRAKTAKVDIPEAWKDKAIMERQAEFRRRMLAKVGQAADSRPPERRKSRPMPGSKASPWKRKMDGKLVPR